MKLWQKLRGGRHQDSAPAPSRPIVVVSGLPRSGTSMMMKMLEAGGLPVLADHRRQADADNPKGYYEFERVKQLDKGDKAWVAEAQGKAVKVISALLEHLPPDYQYRIIFMHRAMEEVLASQRKMLEHRGEANDQVSDEELARLFEKHLAKVQGWLRSQPHFAVLDVNYNAMLAAPRPQIQAINTFLGGILDEEKMAAIVDPNLYRNRT